MPGYGTSKRYSYSVKRDLLYEAVPFGKNKMQGFLRLAVPFSAIELLEQKMKQIIFFAVGLVFIFSLLFTSLISLVVSRPLIEMAGIARAMAGGDFSRKPYLYSKDEIGELARALGHLSDQIRNQIEKIKHEGAKLDAVLSSLFEGIMVVDEKGTILLANPSVRKLFFIDADTGGKTPVEILRSAGIQNIVDKILKEKSRLISEEITISKPEEKILKVNGVPIIRDHRLEGAALVFHDITHLRNLEKVRQDFVANVSHELRTPISSIKGYAETLLGGAMKDKDNLKDFLEIIYQDSGRLATLIDDLLDLSKIESGKMRMALEPLEISTLVKRSLGVLDKTIKEKSLSVTVDLSNDLPKVSADRDRCPQVFLNLLDNAVKYTPDGGSIKVAASVKDKFVQVDISDTGIGIPESDLPRIFERFYRVDKGRSRELGGTGLGLSIVKHIIHAHGGEVWAVSAAGQGSTFSFTIPLV
jgi:two-component system phosphate regulon sensor histidine kinase PhoR